MRIGLHLLTILTLTTFSFPAWSADDPIAARGDDGTAITTSAVAIYSKFISSPYPDPVAVWRESEDEAVRKDAYYFVERSVREIRWLRDAVKRAKAAHFEIVPTDKKAIDQLFQECLTAHSTISRVEPVTTLTLAQATELFAQIPELAPRPENRDIAYIFISTTSPLTLKNPDPPQLLLTDIRTRVLAGEMPFGIAANKWSEASSAAKNGFVGPLTRSTRMNEAFKNLVFSIPEGEISPPTKLDNGWYLVRVEKVRPAFSTNVQEAFDSPSLASLLLGKA